MLVVAVALASCVTKIPETDSSCSCCAGGDGENVNGCPLGPTSDYFHYAPIRKTLLAAGIMMQSPASRH
jgi:hypothetical protein